MRLLICAGGTGGGVYPALTVTERLKNSTDQLLWVGSEDGMEADLVERTGLPYKAIPAAGVHGVSLTKLPKNLLKLCKGYWKSKKLLEEFKPDVLLFTGGYVAIPMALAAHRYPKLLYVPDIEPGLALKSLARFSDKIALTIEQSKVFFSQQEKTIVTGYPIREELMKWNKADGLAYFNFDAAVPILLFMGGSSGARSINQALLAIIEKLIEKFQVIHLTGHLDWELIRKNTEKLGNRYQAFPYLHEMGAAYSAADLVISRAGASVLGEYPNFSLPAILIPYPYAWRYQKVNADYLVDHDAAVMVQDQNLSKELYQTIQQLMSDPDRLQHMSRQMASLAQPQAAQQITALLYEMAEV